MYAWAWKNKKGVLRDCRINLEKEVVWCLLVCVTSHCLSSFVALVRVRHGGVEGARLSYIATKVGRVYRRLGTPTKKVQQI